MQEPLQGLPPACLPARLAARLASAERWAKCCVSRTRTTSRAPPASIRPGHSSARRALLHVYFLFSMASPGCRVASVRQEEVLTR